MTISANTQIEVRTGGDDDNGGGFVTGASGTDFTLQDAATLSLTDLATSGIGVTTLTSVTGGFLAAHIGNLVQIKSGTNVTAGFYEITAHTDTNTVTLDRAPDDGVGGIASGVGSIGGALATPGKMAPLLTVSGMKGWIKTGTYTMTTSTPGAAGPIVTPATAANSVIEGYNSTRGDLRIQLTQANKPIISAGAVTSITLFLGQHSSNPIKALFAVVLDGNSGAANIGVDPGIRTLIAGVHALNCPGHSLFLN